MYPLIWENPTNFTTEIFGHHRTCHRSNKKSSKKKSLRQKSPTRPITHPNSNPVNYTLRVRGKSFLLVFSRRSRFTKWLGLEPKRQGPWRWRIDEKISSSPQGVPPFIPTFYRSITTQRNFQVHFSTPSAFLGSSQISCNPRLAVEAAGWTGCGAGCGVRAEFNGSFGRLVDDVTDSCGLD